MKIRLDFRRNLDFGDLPKLYFWVEMVCVCKTKKDLPLATKYCFFFQDRRVREFNRGNDALLGVELCAEVASYRQHYALRAGDSSRSLQVGNQCKLEDYPVDK